MAGHPDNFDTARNTRRVSGTFFLNGNGAISLTTLIGAGDFTPTRTGVGTATVKVNIPASRVLFCDFQLSKAALAATYLQLLGRTQGGDGMWTFSLGQTTMDGTTPAEFAAANAAAFITFTVVLGLGDASV